MLFISTILTVTFLAVVHALGPPAGSIKNLVPFGDSYTDIVNVGDGGTAWPVYAAGYGNFNLHSFAQSGACCDQRLTPRTQSFPYVVQDELPSYFNATKNGLRLLPQETIYTMWIGTNDVGAGTMLTGQQTPGTTIVNVTACAIDWAKTLYASGARNFLFQNMIPLNLTILYRTDGYLTKFWTPAHNQTEWSVYMTELVAGGNEISKLMLQMLPESLPGAHIGLFDSHSLFEDMFNRPEVYLNGTAPLNVTGCINSCPALANGTVPPCTEVQGTDRDSYLWFDELHPSEQADRVVAREITNAITRRSEKWAMWFS